MSVIDELLSGARGYAEGYTGGDLPVPPSRRLAVVSCMDSRIDVFGLLGLGAGEAHVIRNAGGVVTDDVIRSLTISQRLLGTTEIMLIHHTGCGMLTFTDDAEKERIKAETGIRPTFALEAFPDLDDDVRQSKARLLASPFLLHKSVRGFVFEVESGYLREVE